MALLSSKRFVVGLVFAFTEFFSAFRVGFFMASDRSLVASSVPAISGDFWKVIVFLSAMHF